MKRIKEIALGYTSSFIRKQKYNSFSETHLHQSIIVDYNYKYLILHMLVKPQLEYAVYF